MPQGPSYRFTGDDWDPPAVEPREPEPLKASEASARGGDEPAALRAGMVGAPEAALAAPATTDPAAPATTDPAALTARDGSRGSPPPMRFVALVGRVAPALAPALEHVPPRFLLGGAGVLVAAATILILGSGRPTSITATATALPTVVAAAPTPFCAHVAAPLPDPFLSVQSPGREDRRLRGFASPDAPPRLDGPWPAELPSTEASVALGSTLRLAAGDACIREWRAVAAHPPVATGKSWRPKRAESLELGWQMADRIRWEPAVPLPPRGEWILRVTVWYRQPASPSAAATGAETPAPGDLVVERYFRLVVEAPAS